MMRNALYLFASLSLAALGSTAQAQSTSETVTLAIDINQPSLFSADQKDRFKSTIDDRSGTTTFDVLCSAGASAWLGLSRIDQACSVSGAGVIKNPNNPSQTLPRISYSGGYTVVAKQDGYTDATTILANYLRAGSAPAQNSSFKGNLILKPEHQAESARALGAELIKNLQQTAAGTTAVTYNTQIDSIRFENFTVPDVGQRDSAPCTWTGDAIFAYANNAWQMKLDVKCGDKAFKVEGNMPLVDAAAGSDWQQEYDVNLVLPGAGGGDPFAAADPFATVDGITGVIKLKNSGRATDAGVYEHVQVDGKLTGTGVPLEMVRGYAEIMAVLARTYFGA
ncbi:hypothetical protein GC209_13675 [bacterium]|nr:hypothetical protein [bacterium]